MLGSFLVVILSWLNLLHALGRWRKTCIYSLSTSWSAVKQYASLCLDCVLREFVHQDFGRLAERFPSLCLCKLVQWDPDLKSNLHIYDLWMTSLTKSPLDQCCIHVDQVLSGLQLQRHHPWIGNPICKIWPEKSFAESTLFAGCLYVGLCWISTNIGPYTCAPYRRGLLARVVVHAPCSSSLVWILYVFACLVDIDTFF